MNTSLSYIYDKVNNDDDIVEYFNQELRRSRDIKQLSEWGRKAIIALDLDNPEGIVDIFVKNKHIYVSNINEQVTPAGYAGYLWTISIHRYLGDTLLHLAIKMNKLKIIYIILLYNFIISEKNSNNESCEQLCQRYYSLSLTDMKHKAFEELSRSLNPLKFEAILPIRGEYLSLRSEAFYLMENGRILRSNRPQRSREKNTTNDASFTKQSNTHRQLKLVPNWRRRYDKSFGDIPYLINTQTGEKRGMNEQEKTFGYWDRVLDHSNTTYLINELTGKIKLETACVDDVLRMDEKSALSNENHQSANEINTENIDSNLLEVNDITGRRNNLHEETNITTHTVDRTDQPTNQFQSNYNLNDPNAESLSSNLPKTLHEVSDIIDLLRHQQQSYANYKKAIQQTVKELTIMEPSKHCHIPFFRSDDLIPPYSNVLVTKAKEMNKTNDIANEITKLRKVPKMELYHHLLNALQRTLRKSAHSRIGKVAINYEINKEIDQTIIERNFLDYFTSLQLSNDISSDSMITDINDYRSINQYNFKNLSKDDLKCSYFDPRIHRQITSLSTVHNLKYISLDEASIEYLFQVLTNDEIITNINLSNANIKRLTSVFCQALPSISSLTSLDLSRNFISDDDILSSGFIEALSNSKRIRYLSLAGNRLSGKSLIPLIETLIRQPSFECLNVIGNNLTDEEKSHIESILRRIDSIASLDSMSTPSSPKSLNSPKWETNEINQKQLQQELDDDLDDDDDDANREIIDVPSPEDIGCWKWFCCNYQSIKEQSKTKRILEEKRIQMEMKTKEYRDCKDRRRAEIRRLKKLIAVPPVKGFENKRIIF